MLRDKYKCGSGAMPQVKDKQICSNVWRGITHIWDDFLKGVTWRLGDGRTVHFWQDPWCDGNRSLECSINSSLSSSMRDLKACELVEPDRKWNAHIINQFIPQYLAEFILLMPPPCDDAGRDTVAWSYTSNGMFSIKSAYENLMPMLDYGNADMW